MALPSTPETHSSRAAHALVGLAVVGASCAALNGFPRYDVAQLVVGGVLGGVAALAIAAVALSQGAAHGTRGGRLLAAWGVALAWVFAQALARGGDPRAIDQVALFAIAALPMAAAWRAPSAGSLRGTLAFALGVAGIAGGLASIIQRTGGALPPPIPFSTDVEAGIRALSDDPWNAASWGLIAVPACLMLGVSTRGLARATALAGALGAAATVGLSGYVPAVAALAIATLAGVAVAFARPGTAPRAPRLAAWFAAPLVVALAGMALAPNREVEPPSEFARTAEIVDVMATGQFAPWTDEGALGFYRAGARQYAVSALGLGHGPGAMSGAIMHYVDHDDAWALAHTAGLSAPERAPVPFYELLGDYGVATPLFLLAALALAFGMGLQRAGRRDAPQEAAAGAATAGIVVSALAALVVAPGLLTVPAFAALGVALAAVIEGAPTDTPPRPRAPLFALMVGTFAVLVTVSSVQTGLWGLKQAGGVVFAGHGMAYESLPRFEAAAARQRRYESERNLAVAMIYTPSVEHPARQIADHLLEAARMRPADASSRYLLANHFLRNLTTLATSAEDMTDRRAEIVASLARAVELDPNHVEAGLLLAQTHLGFMEGAEALAVLTAMEPRPFPAIDRSRVLGQLAAVYAESFDDPQHALEYYERALEFESRPRVRDFYTVQIETMRVWLQSGRRPIVDDTDHPLLGGHGPDDGHDHGPQAPSSPHDDEGSGAPSP